MDLSLQSSSRIGLCLYRHGMPDVGAVLPYGAVGRELSHTGDIQDRHARPLLLVTKSFVDLVLAFQIRLEIREDHIRIVVKQRIDDGLEQIAVPAGEHAGSDLRSE